jgi:oxalate decarboxylase
MSDELQNDQTNSAWSRRNWLRAGSTSIATAAFAGLAAHAQQPASTLKAEHDNSISNPGPKNKPVFDANPNSNIPPPTDHGDFGTIWYSFDLAHKKLMEGGWTHQVTERELPLSKEIAGVNMRLTAGSFRELHWHTADEWAYMLEGNARVTVLNPDGTVFIGDVSKGDLWLFPAGFPHSIQGLNPDGCEFLLVFNEGSFSEENTFLLSEWVAHTPPEVLAKNLGLNKKEIDMLPTDEMFIFPAELPRSLEEDRLAAGGKSVESKIDYTFKMASMPATKKTSGGEVRVVDSKNFPISKQIAAGLVRIKPGGIRELHWHPNASEWQYWIEGQGRMTVFMPVGKARTMDFKANDVGFVPAVAGHYIENTGDTDLVFLEMFKAPEFLDFSLNNWMRRLPAQMITSHLGLPKESIDKIPVDKQEVIAG